MFASLLLADEFWMCTEVTIQRLLYHYVTAPPTWKKRLV